MLRADLPAVVETLSGAFYDDPLTRWLLGEADGYAARLEQWMRFAVETGLAHGHLYATDAQRAAAVWSAPDSSLFDGPWGQQLAELLVGLLGESALPRMKSLAVATVDAHAEEPHFYLFLLGSHPDAQRSGLGSTLLVPVLEKCDAEGIAVHLESSNPRNLPFYQRHGFEVVCEKSLEPGGPVVHPMRRAPR